MINLNLNETRVLGVLFEKERTTPDQYPLSLNALTNGCNQKSNREPVLNLSEVEVQSTIDLLIEQGLVAEVAVGSRVKKYRQRFANTQFSEFNFTIKEQSIISVLFLRGAQTPGELRARTNRLCEFTSIDEVETALNDLCDRSGNAYIKKLPREPGKRESRYVHLFSGGAISVSEINESENNSLKDDESHNSAIPTGNSTYGATSNLNADDRISMLEQQVSEMQNEIDELKRLWDELNN